MSTTAAPTITAPFPYFGGKRRVAAEVWRRFGNVDNYCEPFFGSGAVLLARPHAAKVETVNDADRFLANFWRALQADAEGVAEACDWPVNETDLHARHRWLVTEGAARIAACADDPAHYDAQVAGWWVWGASAWIGSGWCESPDRLSLQLPCVSEPSGRGGHRALTSERLPYLSRAGMGIHQIPAPSVPEQIPHLSNAGQGGDALSRRSDLLDYLRALSARLRFVRVACGDFARILGPSVTTRLGTTGILLDPPYGEGAVDYGAGGNRDGDVFARAAAWAVENAGDPKMRIALCGYEGAFDPPKGWHTHTWKAQGGYGSQGQGEGRKNAHRETVWFSPHCLMPQADLFTSGDGALTAPPSLSAPAP